MISSISSSDGISVVMPVHNGGPYLQSAIDSILQQRAHLFELIIIDDHSNDNAIKNLPGHPLVKVIESTERGIVAALNIGIEAAKYPLIARMDADDLAAPHRLMCQKQYLLSNPEVEICGARVSMFRNSKDSSISAAAEGYLVYESWINALTQHEDIEREFWIESPIPHPTAMFRKSSFDDLGGYHNSSWPEDYDLWCRALLQGKKFGKPDSGPLLRWRDHNNRLSRNDARYSKQEFLSCKAYYLAKYLKDEGIDKVSIWGAGKTGLKLHDLLLDQGIAIDGFIDVNQKLRNREKRGKTVFVSERTEQGWSLPHSQSMILVAVSARGARTEIREVLTNSGRVEARDFILVA